MEHLTNLASHLERKLRTDHYSAPLIAYAKGQGSPSRLTSILDGDTEWNPPCLAIKTPNGPTLFCEGKHLFDFTVGKHSFKFLLPPDLFLVAFENQIDLNDLIIEFHVPVEDMKITYVLQSQALGPLEENLLADGRYSIPFTALKATLLDVDKYSHLLDQKDAYPSKNGATDPN